MNRTLILVRPALFCLIRLATFILRAHMAEKAYSENLLRECTVTTSASQADRPTAVVELVLVSTGYLFLLEPVVALWRRSMQFACPPGTEPQWIKYLTRVTYFCILAALITGVLAVTQGITLFDDHGRVAVGGSTNFRNASYTLTLRESRIMRAG